MPHGIWAAGTHSTVPSSVPLTPGTFPERAGFSPLNELHPLSGGKGTLLLGAEADHRLGTVGVLAGGQKS